MMKPTDLAYIAGFLDGDGSIFFQLIRKNDYRLGFQIRPSLAFYQKTDNEQILVWLKEQLIAGCLRRRGTGISDYTIVEPSEVRRLLNELPPYVRLKRNQSDVVEHELRLRGLLEPQTNGVAELANLGSASAWSSKPLPLR